MHKFSIWMSSALLLPFLALTHQNDDLINRISTSLNTWQEKSPQEKIYLHTDKPYYAIGDTAWFKGYLVTGSRHQLSAVSGVMYVDLINDADSVISALRLPVTAGMCKGNFVFSDGLSEGNYRVRAYTNWMRNAGKAYFYDRTFTVGNVVTETVSSRIAFREEAGNAAAELSYTDKSGSPVANKLVIFRLVSGDKILLQDRKKTDAQGRLMISFAGKKIDYTSNAYLRTQIELAAGESSEKVFPLQNPLISADIGFFPESGDLVSGIRTRVAFKATGNDGLGLAVSGRIVDDQDQEVAQLQSVHQGMGFFFLQPESGRTYRAIFRGEKGTEKTVALPTAKESGYGMAVYNFPDRDSVLVRISAAASLREKPVVLVAQASGELLFASELRFGKAFVSAYLPKKGLTSGILQFTLFADERPVNERVVFIRNADEMRTTLETDKKSYAARAPVTLKIKGENSSGQPSSGQFSVSVFNESVAPVNEMAETSILSQLLLSSDIRGYIEKPNQYFVRKDDSVSRDLDLLMMTQAYRRFTWADILNGKPGQNPHAAEKLLDQLSGTLKDLSGKPVAAGKLTLLFAKSGQMIDTVSDASGRFVFKNLLLLEGTRLSIQGRTAKNGKKVEVVLDSVSKQGMSLNPNRGDLSTDIQGQIKTYLENTRIQDEALQKNGRTGRMQLLREVQVKARKKTPEISYNMNGAGNADQVIKGEEFQNCRNLSSCIQGRLAGVVFRTQMVEGVGPVTLAYSTRNNGGGNLSQNDGAMLIVLNGRPLYNRNGESMLNISEIFDQNTINVNDIASIEVLRTPGKTAIYGDNGQNGVILINTKGVVFDEKYDPSMVSFAARGFSNPKEFYTPKYEVKTANPVPDMRTTVYWNPDVRTAADGTASVNFYNGDQKGTYRVLLEGMNERGELARQIIRYTVE
ncbi:MAG: TonB-dependent receptor plug domain-containing protein [Mucilaginibacter polytrichastri]|nr:TonB-dependent receptor plug domain-containing protein [Mucilaginibacter polytrichastri]